MGWNDSRVTLVPPGWQIAIEESDKRSFDGSPVRIEYAERSDHFAEIKINAEEVYAWLKKQGFELQRRSDVGLRMRRADIEAFVVFHDDELSQLILTFTLSSESPLRWRGWKDFVIELCRCWDLRPYNPNLGFTVGPSDVLLILSDTPAWNDFECRYDWPTDLIED